jgi:hypothetical protein
LRPTLPARGPARFSLVFRLAFWPFDGGVLELSGVFGGSFSLASSSATRAVNLAFSARSAATSATSASTRSSSAWISASFWSCESWERSGRGASGVIRRLNRELRPVSRSCVGHRHATLHQRLSGVG